MSGECFFHSLLLKLAAQQAWMRPTFQRCSGSGCGKAGVCSLKVWVEAIIHCDSLLGSFREAGIALGKQACYL